LAALSFNIHPIVQQSDFSDTEAYMLWKQGEEQQLNQLIAYALTANPKLLSETTNPNGSGNQVRCQYGVVSYGKDEVSNTYSFIINTNIYLWIRIHAIHTMLLFQNTH
jgi:hypothetical protein